MAGPVLVKATWGTSAHSGWSILVHGGAGDVSDEAIASHVDGCREAVEVGGRALAAGGTALDAAQKAVEALENNPLFNAGKGASLTDAGTIELDASIMSGEGLRAGGVCSLPPFYNPIAIARQVLESGGPVLYADRGAERFALDRGFIRATDADLITARSRERWEHVRATGSVAGYAGGTVGAVAIDSKGHTAAATSTGGMMNKPRGRVGDSPIIGAGTYADDDSGACSNTGDGEAVIRLCLAREACCLLLGGKALPETVARQAIALLGEKASGSGGMILIDKFGRMGLARSTKTMAWGAMSAGWSEPRSGS
ncbi:MAG: isoaspartyl peptidase/L-asparaginase [Polyangiaceae bacterium]